MSRHVLSSATLAWLKTARPLWLHGQYVERSAGLSAVRNPATGEVIAQAHIAGPEQVDLAVIAARQAFASGVWAHMHEWKRAKIMWRLAELIEHHREELAELDSLCMGKPLHIGREMELPYFAATFRYYAGWISKLSGQSQPLAFPAGDLHGITLLEPIGVVGMILPWNGPLVIAGWKIAAALAAGCSCVIKPADITPLSILRFAELAQAAGVPDGVINIVPGPGSVTGQAIALHPDIDKLAFTGSGSVGRSLLSASAHSNLKKLSLELGGKSPVLVFQDAQIDAAVAGAIDAIFGNSGQVCVAGSRLYLQRGVHEAFLAALVSRARALKVGDPFLSDTDMGPMASVAHAQSVRQHIERAIREGAQLLCGGYAVPEQGEAYVLPTILLVQEQNSALVQEEIFGPVLAVSIFDTEQAAISLANGTEYALAASVWTGDVNRVWRVVRALHSGIVWVNTHNIPDLAMPIGGQGLSGWGRELGWAGLNEYIQTKSVMLRIAASSENA